MCVAKRNCISLILTIVAFYRRFSKLLHAVPDSPSSFDYMIADLHGDFSALCYLSLQLRSILPLGMFRSTLSATTQNPSLIIPPTNFRPGLPSTLQRFFVALLMPCPFSRGVKMRICSDEKPIPTNPSHSEKSQQLFCVIDRLFTTDANHRKTPAKAIGRFKLRQRLKNSHVAPRHVK